MSQSFVSPDIIRSWFSRAMSDMYKSEVPLYGSLLDLVAQVNAATLQRQPELEQQLQRTGELERLDVERHGAIRLGTAQELQTMRRVFAAMGMQPVGYYDLSPAGVPVHSTAFRATHEASLQISPFRVFTSLLRLELIADESLRQKAAGILANRRIFTDRLLELVALHEQQGGLTQEQGTEFVTQALHTFRWHSDATVTLQDYRELHDQHRLIADVVAFKGPHINHLTPRTLDIDQIQRQMPAHGIPAKAVVEGPPTRRCPILLRQTSFKALEESVSFSGQPGSHTARFGEIEQRGVALTPKGRALYDTLLNEARSRAGGAPTELNADAYMRILQDAFQAFPDDYAALREQGLAYFRYFLADAADRAELSDATELDLEALIRQGMVQFEPLVYEDFLPVSAAGIFQSNLGDQAQARYAVNASQAALEHALGVPIQNELQLYEQTQQRSIHACLHALQGQPQAQAL